MCKAIKQGNFQHSDADTEYEVINHLCEEIVSVYEDLKGDKDNLGRLPKKWLAFLEEVIEGR